MEQIKKLEALIDMTIDSESLTEEQAVIYLTNDSEQVHLSFAGRGDAIIDTLYSAGLYDNDFALLIIAAADALADELGIEEEE